MFSIQGSLFNVRRAVRHSPRHSPRRSLFAAPFASSFTAPFAAPFPIHFPQFSLFKLRYSMFTAPLAIRSSPFANRRAIRHAIPCRFSMSPDAFLTQELHSVQIIDICAIHHVLTFGCLLYPKERQQFWTDQLGVRFMPFFNYGRQTSHQCVHRHLIYLNIYSLYIPNLKNHNEIGDFILYTTMRQDDL